MQDRSSHGKEIGKTDTVAAAIRYAETNAPAWLPRDLNGVPGLRFFRMTAIDGVEIEAVLREASARDPRSAALVISVHGSGGNYATSVPGALLRGLAEFSVLGINTRQHDGAINTDNFFDVRKDIEAAVYAARSLGFRHIVLHGQSLGNIQVQYYAATNWDPGIKAVVLTGMFANLPWKSRHMLVRDERRYREMYDSALGLLRDNRETEPLPQKITSYAGVPDSVPVTSQHFLTYRSAAVATADGTYWIKRIPRPILMVRDEGDLVVRDFEPGMLIAAAKSEESLVPRIDFVLLPNANKADPLGHSFGNNQAQLVTIIADWLNKVGL